MTLSSHQLYRAMICYLGEVYDMEDNDSLGAFLNALTITPAGVPRNVKLRESWEQLFRRAGKESVGFRDGWMLMEEFVREAAIAADVPGMDRLVSYLALREHDTQAQEAWRECAKEAASLDSDWPE